MKKPIGILNVKNILLCFIVTFYFSYIHAQSFLWSGYGRGQGIVTSVASNEQGNCFLTGWLTKDFTVHFGPYTLMDPTVTHPQLEQFLVKYSHNGNLLWAKQTIDSGVGGAQSGGSICPDRFGNLYLASNFTDTLIIGTYTVVNTRELDSYVAKYDPLGNVKWVTHSTCNRTNGGTGNEHISCDINGNVYLSGAFGDTVNFGGHTIIDSSIQFNIFLVKYDSNGNVKWAKQSSGDGGNVSFSNTNDQFGNSFVTGEFEDTLSFDSYQLIGGENGDFYVVKYDSNGNVKWVKKNIEIGSGIAVGVSLAADLTGNVYALGQFTDSIIFGHDTLMAPARLSSFFIAKYDPNGNLLWVKEPKILDNNSWNAWSLSIDNYKHLYLSVGGGYHTCKIAFGGDTLSMYDTASRDAASVIFKLDSNGNAICSSIVPAGGAQQPNAIASDTSGNYVYFGATALTPVIFGKDTVNPFSIPAPSGGNGFPFAARWEECNPNVIYAGIQDVKPIGQVVLYPNPNNGSFTLALQNVNEPAQVEVYNMLGENIYKTKLNPTNTVLSLNGQSNGVYFYRVIEENGDLVGSGKMVIEK